MSKKAPLIGAGVVALVGAIVWFSTREPEAPEGPAATGEAGAQEQKRLMAEMPGTYRDPGAAAMREYVPQAVLREEERLMNEMPGTYKRNPARVDIDAAVRKQIAQQEAEAKKAAASKAN